MFENYDPNSKLAIENIRLKNDFVNLYFFFVFFQDFVYFFGPMVIEITTDFFETFVLFFGFLNFIFWGFSRFEFLQFLCDILIFFIQWTCM